MHRTQTASVMVLLALAAPASAQVAILAQTDDWLVQQFTTDDRISCLVARMIGDEALFYHSFSADTDGRVTRNFTFQPTDYKAIYDDVTVTMQIGEFTFTDVAQFNSNRFVLFPDPASGGVMDHLREADAIITNSPDRRGEERWDLSGINDVLPAFDDCRTQAAVLSN